MALPASDNFSGADGQSLTAYSANWTVQNGGFTIQSGAVAPASSGNECAAYWSADSFGADQYAQATVLGLQAAAIGLAVRVSTGTADTYYGFYSDNGASYLFKMVSGSWTQIGSNGPAWSPGDVVRLEVSGTTLTPKVNGSTSSIGAHTDSSIASGAAGITGWSQHTSARIDNWSGGNLGGSPVVYTLTCNVGHFAMTGNSAALARTKKLVAASASFVQSTQSANLLLTRAMIATVGSFQVSGSAAAIAASRNLSALAASFAISGNAADLVASRALVANTGSFAVSGNDLIFSAKMLFVIADLAVPSASNDGQYSYAIATGAPGTFNAGAAIIQLGRATDQYGGFFRFVVDIPSGAHFSSAYLTLVAANTEAGSVAHARIRAALATAPVQPTTAAAALTATKTTAFVDFDPVDWTNNTTYQTADISDVLNEVAALGALSSILIFLDENANTSTNDIYIAACEDTARAEPQLHIEYTAPIPIIWTLQTRSFTMTSYAANIAKSSKLTAIAGLYSVTDYAILMLAVRKLTGFTGSFALSFSMASLLRTYLISAQSEAFALQAYPAVLRAAKKITAVSGSFDLQLFAALLRFSGTTPTALPNAWIWRPERIDRAWSPEMQTRSFAPESVERSIIA